MTAGMNGSRGELRDDQHDPPHRRLVPDDLWPDRRAVALAAGALAAEIGCRGEFARGFIPSSNDRRTSGYLDRLRDVGAIPKLGVDLLMETGQERPRSCCGFSTTSTPRTWA
jgi:hypothetical protein